MAYTVEITKTKTGVNGRTWVDALVRGTGKALWTVSVVKWTDAQGNAATTVYSVTSGRTGYEVRRGSKLRADLVAAVLEVTHK